MTTLTEADVEAAALAWLADVGWRMARGPDIAPDAPGAERDGYGQVALERRLRGALVRRNTFVIADEAHRSRYDFVDGIARHMRDALPNTSFVGFTGTPIELEDASTVAPCRCCGTRHSAAKGSKRTRGGTLNGRSATGPFHHTRPVPRHRISLASMGPWHNHIRIDDSSWSTGDN